MAFKASKIRNVDTIVSAYTFKVVANTGKYQKLLDAVNLQQQATDFALSVYKTELLENSASVYSAGSTVYHALKEQFPSLSSQARGAICQSINASTENGKTEKLKRTTKIDATLWYLSPVFNLQKSTGCWNLWLSLPVEKISATRYGNVNVALAYSKDKNPLENAIFIDRVDIRLVPHKGKKALYAKVTVTEPVPALTTTDRILGIDQNFENVALSTGRLVSVMSYVKQKRNYKQELKRSQANKEKLGNGFANKSDDFWKKFAHELALTAKRLGYTSVSVENLKHIRKSSPSVGGKRCRFNFCLHNSFPTSKFQSLLSRALRKLGIDFIQVPAKYTSQTCSSCGHREKKNRISQARFVCRSCGYTINADKNAAVNIRNVATTVSKLTGGCCKSNGRVQSMASLAAAEVSEERLLENPTACSG